VSLDGGGYRTLVSRDNRASRRAPSKRERRLRREIFSLQMMSERDWLARSISQFDRLSRAGLLTSRTTKAAQGQTRQSDSAPTLEPSTRTDGGLAQRAFAHSTRYAPSVQCVSPLCANCPSCQSVARLCCCVVGQITTILPRAPCPQGALRDCHGRWARNAMDATASTDE
jgi:hypothetical protein